MTRFGYSDDLISLPMIHALLQNQIEHSFQMIRLKEEDILKKLLNGTLDMGILSPYFYARKQGSIRIVRQFPVINRQPIASILLFFQGNLKTIDRVYWKKNLHAQYEYFLPRLKGLWTHLERQKGGIGMRGPGETEIETDRRIVRDKISLLKKS